MQVRNCQEYHVTVPGKQIIMTVFVEIFAMKCSPMAGNVQVLSLPIGNDM